MSVLSVLCLHCPKLQSTGRLPGWVEKNVQGWEKVTQRMCEWMRRKDYSSQQSYRALKRRRWAMLSLCISICSIAEPISPVWRDKLIFISSIGSAGYFLRQGHISMHPSIARGHFCALLLCCSIFYIDFHKFLLNFCSCNEGQAFYICMIQEVVKVVSFLSASFYLALTTILPS